MPRTAKPFSLTIEARDALSAMLRKGTHPARKLTRARILLKLDEGLSPPQVAREAAVCQATVYNVRAKAEKLGYQAAIEEKHRSGRPPEIAPQARAQITALACSHPPTGRGAWSLRLLADKAVELGFVDSISHQSVGEILKKTSSNPT